MIAALALLFLDEETTFWLLVAVVEHILPRHYFSGGMTASQADQRVLKGVIVSDSGWC